MAKGDIPTRKRQRFYGGLGAHFTSPKKRREPRHKTTKMRTLSNRTKVDLAKSRLSVLEKEFQDRQARAAECGEEGQAQGRSGEEEQGRESEVEMECENDEAENETLLPDGTEQETDEMQQDQCDLQEGGCDADEEDQDEMKKPKRLIPDDTAEELFARWNALLPHMVAPYLQYVQDSVGKHWSACPTELTAECRKEQCSKSSHTVIGLMFASYTTFRVTACECQALPCVLVSKGLFPTSPHAPRMAVSLELLDLLLVVSERSSDAVTALSAAVNQTYRRRGFVLLNSKGQRVKQPFRRGLGYALRWYDCLHVQVERRMESAITDKFALGVEPSQSSPAGDSMLTITTDSPEVPAVLSQSSNQLPSVLMEADPLLQARCPACFGGKKWGTSLEEGGDFHIAVDCCFNHRHLRAVAQSPKFHTPDFILMKEEVDKVGARIELGRSRPTPRVASVPDESIDSCQDSHEAGTGSNVKTSLERFDIGGLAAIVCRHETPLFVANVDTPGEQQKYAVALIEHVLALLPPNATATTLYDVGCVLDRSSLKYDMFSLGVRDRIQFATSVMHAYVHQWSCQLHYNPRMKTGLGLSDGENVERLWSKMRKLIGVCRQSSLSRRDWLIDRALVAVASECRDNLGAWMRRKLAKGVVEQQKSARRMLDESELTQDEITEQWGHQKETQLSVRAHAPQRLKKELDHVLRIQDEADTLGNTVSHSLTLISKGVLPAECRESLKCLQDRLTTVHSQAHNVYLSLNVNVEFPTLQGVDLDFIRKLFMLRELKATVQKKATSAFWEFDKLDQAAGGKKMALGTKMHQHVRAAMSKKVKALEDVIKRYNKDCQALGRLAKPGYTIPLPQPLPTDLSELKESTTLMETIWVDPLDENTHRWVREPDVREGIRCLHKVNRCIEERRRLGKEADNMLRWYARRLSAVVNALQDPANEDIACLLRQEYDDLLALPNEWETPLVNAQRFLSEAASRVTNKPSKDTRIILLWITPTVVDEVHGEEIAVSRVQSGEGLVEQEWDGDCDAPEDVLFRDLIDEHADQEEGSVVRQQQAPGFVLKAMPSNTVQPDKSLLRDLQALCPPALSPESTRRRLLARVSEFGEDEYARLNSPTGWLNDECMNGLSYLLRKVLSESSVTAHAHRCAIFSSFYLSFIRNKTPDRLWPSTRRMEYWKKDIWILPIHRCAAKHWVLAVITPYRHTVYLFDSFADNGAWEQELPDIMSFVQQLVINAGQNGHKLPIQMDTVWRACPLIELPVQTNSHDCGVWVLGCIAAVLRGFHVPSIMEDQVPRLRYILFSYLTSVPLSSIE